MTLTIAKPTIGGSEDTWGATINTALDGIVTAVNANEAAVAAVVTFPAGGIIMWSGSVATIPAGWNLCDGTSSTPDLRNRFVVGAGDTYSPDDTGGSDSVTLTTAQMPSHSHSGSTNTAGNHSHTVSAGPGDGGTARAANTDGSGESFSTNSAGNHSHSLSINSTGGGGSHENRPPYYALAYIMKA